MVQLIKFDIIITWLLDHKIKALIYQRNIDSIRFESKKEILLLISILDIV